MQNQHPQNIFYGCDPEAEGSWCIQPSNLPFIHFSIKGKIYGIFHEHCAGSKILLFDAKKKQKEEDKRLSGNKRIKLNALKVKCSFAQLILFILVLILCPIQYWPLVTWKFINLFTNTLWHHPVQRGQKRAYFRGGRVMEIDTFGPRALMGRPCRLSSTGK